MKHLEGDEAASRNRQYMLGLSKQAGDLAKKAAKRGFEEFADRLNEAKQELAEGKQRKAQKTFERLKAESDQWHADQKRFHDPATQKAFDDLDDELDDLELGLKKLPEVATRTKALSDGTIDAEFKVL